MFKVGNMTGFESYPGLEYMNEYNKTGMLHLKYKNMNQTEVPQMNFVKREDKLNINIINNIDLDNIIRMNNIEPLKNISGNLICQEIKEEDFEDKNLPKLLKTFQYALEYLNAKRMKLVKTNEKLHIEYEQLINQSLELEKKLKENKNEITRNKSKKKEHELLLLTYESLVNFNCNPTENTNIIMRNIKSNYGLNVSEKNISNKIETYQRNERYYCHVCNGKYFNTERGLENHMKRRHLAQIRQNSEKEEEEMKAEEIQELYDKKLEETKNHFQNLLMQKNDIISKANLEEEINMIKRETNEKYKLIMESNDNFKENMGNILKDYKIQQDDINQKLLNIAKISKENQENKEMPKVTVNQINNLINSIENMTETFKQNMNNNNEEIKKDINEKSKDIQNLNSIKNDYNLNYMNNNINLDNNNNINNDNNNINNDNNNIYNNKNIMINKEPQNTLIDINKNFIEEKEASFNKENNNNTNNNNNFENKEEKNADNINNNINKNNIISQGDFISNNDNNFKEFNNQGQTINNNIENPKKNEEEINISKLAANNKILESNIEFNQNMEENDNNKNNNLLNKKGNNDLGSIKEDSIKEINDNNNKNDINNSFSKTDPNAFKKNDENNFEPLKTFTNNDKLINFAKDFTNRDKPILDIKDPNINDINGFSKEILEDKKFKLDSNSENVENFIEDNAEDKNFERIKDLDKKDKGELLDVIKNTLNNINKINEKSKVAGLYFETMNKLIDFKMLEKEEEMMREAYNQKGILKRTRSKSSKASIVIQNAEDDIKESENQI